jgi:carnosine N-methyltransferase
MFSYSSKTSARCVPGTSHCKSAFIVSAHKTTNYGATLSTDTIVMLLLVLTFSYIVYSRTYTFPDFFADLRAIIYGETFKGFSSSASTEDIEKSRERARAAFARYGTIALAEAQEKRKALNALTREHRRIAQYAGYSKKLELLDESVRVNTVLTNAIANIKFSAVDLPATVRSRSRLSVAVGSEEISRVREAMKHFVRDWSQEGEKEREVIFTPVLQAVRRWMSQECGGAEGGRDVLVPGCGLARLAWEVNRLGT